ncbi:DUF4249 domain-containing protein [bacterium]|nr:DUF4249 domain-containing protein [bacterium]
MKYLFYIAMLLGLIACERQLNIDLPEFDPKLVVNSEFAPGKPMTFYLSESVQILDEPQLRSGIYSGRIIILEDSAVVFDKMTAIDSGFLYTTIVPKYGKHYEAFFDIDDYPLTVAEDIVPGEAPEFEITSFIPLGDRYQVNFNIKDLPNEQNYLIQAFLIGKKVNGTDTTLEERPVGFSSNDKVFLTNIYSFNSNNRFALFSDKVFSNSSREISINIKRTAGTEPGFFPEKVVLQISSLSASYFNYIVEITENNHVYGGPLSSASYDAGNIKNGLGIFGAYTYLTDTVSIR